MGEVMSGGKRATQHDFMRRYEQLKRMWFNGAKVSYDSDGEPMPSMYDRNAVAKMFEQMGVEIPTSPNDSPKMLPRRSDD
jgi:hypothetical protein